MKALTPAVIASLILGSSIFAFGQQNKHEQHTCAAKTQTQSGAMNMKAPTMAMCKQMMADKEKSMAHMKAMDLQLDALVTKMDSATSENKLDATVAVLKELVAQRKKVHSMMKGMDSQMMGHMMQHMKSGKMEDCPMMKDMMGSDGTIHGRASPRNP